MNDYQYYWAYRYADTNEPALVLLADSAFQNDQMLSIALFSPMLTRNDVSFATLGDPLRSVRLSEAELDTWRAFELCPVVKVEVNDDQEKFLFNTVQVK